MKEFTHVITNEIGIHARPAAMLVKATKAFESKVTIVKGDRSAKTGSLTKLMSLGAGKGDEVTVRIEGTDEEAAYAALSLFFQENF